MGTGEMNQTKACGRASLQTEMLVGRYKTDTHLHTRCLLQIGTWDKCVLRARLHLSRAR